MTDTVKPISVVIAGGGTAGHIEPALAVADALRAVEPTVRITALGTHRGLETTLVPERGYDLRLIPPVPVPRKLNTTLFRLPLSVARSVRATRAILDEVKADLVIGFGGYVSAPAYLAARLHPRRMTVFVHEANARAGMANKLGVAIGGHGLAAVAGSGIKADIVGIPVRAALSNLDRAGLRAEARAFYGLDEQRPVLLVTGGSQGARSINTAVSAAEADFAAAGVQVLHAYGKKNELTAPARGAGEPAYRALPYIERMDLALAAADMVLCRSGAMTVAETSAVGLPAAYVPLPHGNGEQALNASGVIAAGGGLIIADADLSPDTIRTQVLPIITDPERCAAMGAAAAGAGSRDAAAVIAGRILDTVRAT